MCNTIYKTMYTRKRSGSRVFIIKTNKEKYMQNDGQSYMSVVNRQRQLSPTVSLCVIYNSTKTLSPV